jgi:AraC family transcriptional regulator of adaptative response/methylated-DNA-[protein]-cysteine methyltransferase
MTPSDFRDKGANNTIYFSVRECSLGMILVAATRKGVCAILLGNDPLALTEDLRKRFSRAHLVGGDPLFDSLVAKAVGLAEHATHSVELPPDVRRTAFQQKAWGVLQSIAIGQSAYCSEVTVERTSLSLAQMGEHHV